MRPDAITLVTTKPEAEVAADIKLRFEAAMKPALAIMDEAAKAGLLVQFDGVGKQPPFFTNHGITGLRIAKVY